MLDSSDNGANSDFADIPSIIQHATIIRFRYCVYDGNMFRGKEFILE